MLLSINQISELTGQDRRTITKQLDGLPFQPGDKNAYLYESIEALSRVYAMDTLEAARAAQARSQASLNTVREEDLRKQRIPIQIVLDTMDEVFQSIAATIKASKRKTLTIELINELFDKFRSAPASLKW